MLTTNHLITSMGTSPPASRTAGHSDTTRAGQVLYLPITSSPSSLGLIRRLPVCILPTTTSPLNPSLAFKWYTVNPAVFLDQWRLGRGDWQPHDCDESRSAESGGVYRGVPWTLVRALSDTVPSVRGEVVVCNVYPDYARSRLKMQIRHQGTDVLMAQTN
ncbi:hypothetical protein VTJ04DRAFT_9110 [Mycothermus thermophilus]|uniref:uncharacterized protein n=1 Tax=Humicola insolens TaxID=85995 RepID=UPI0037444062